jgi:hypothetical protein
MKTVREESTVLSEFLSAPEFGHEELRRTHRGTFSTHR